MEGILTEVCLPATLCVNVLMLAVSCLPVSLSSFFSPKNEMSSAWLSFKPAKSLSIAAILSAAARVELVEILTWHPDPFQSPLAGFGSKIGVTSYCSQTLYKMYLDSHI